jgi:circadian clock protein KaiC
MKLARSSPVAALRKSPSGVLGFDEITGGGLPRGRTTLLAGGPGCGKTIFALQFLVNGARDFAEPGIFVAFEESSRRIVANAESFGWRLSQLRRKKLLFVDAQPAKRSPCAAACECANCAAAMLPGASES